MKHDAKSILKAFQAWQGIYWQSFQSHQIDIQLDLSSDYYRKHLLSENFKLDSATEGYLLNILKNVKVTKAAGIDEISGKFFKDGARISAISDLCNLFMAL